MSAAVLTLLAVVVVVEAVLLVGLLRSHALILQKLHELGAGIGDPSGRDPAPAGPGFQTRPEVPAPRDEPGFAEAADLGGVDLDGNAVALRVVGTDHDTLLAFLSSGCLTCKTFFEAFATGEATVPDGIRPVIVAKGDEAESPDVLAALAPPGVQLVRSSQAWSAYRVPGSPYFVYVDGQSGRVRGEGTGMTWDQVAGLFAQATGDLRLAGGSGPIAKPSSDAERERQIDDELLAAGIRPGDPSLYTPPPLDGSPPDPSAPPADDRDMAE